MFRDIHKSIVTKKWMRNIPLLLLIIPVLSVELYLFAYGRDDTFRDRFSFYSLSLLTGVSFFLFPKNKKYFAAYFICSLLLCTIYVIHTSLLYGNNGGFDIENLMHLCDFRSMLQFLKFNPHYIWEGPLVILFLAMISFVSGYFIFEACYPRPRKIFINKMFLLFLAGAMLFLWGKTFYPVDDFISIAKFASEVRKYRSFDKEIYWRQGIKVTAKTADEIIASPGKNLVFIILESTELAYLDEKFFPGLLPELKKWRGGTQSFENVTMARNATLTFGAMFSMMTGAFLTPEYLVSGVNSHTKPYVGSRLASLPKILNKAGYHQFFLAGHSGNFAGTENFVKNQKYDETTQGKNDAGVF